MVLYRRFYEDRKDPLLQNTPSSPLISANNNYPQPAPVAATLNASTTPVNNTPIAQPTPTNTAQSPTPVNDYYGKAPSQSDYSGRDFFTTGTPDPYVYKQVGNIVEAYNQNTHLTGKEVTWGKDGLPYVYDTRAQTISAFEGWSRTAEWANALGSDRALSRSQYATAAGFGKDKPSNVWSADTSYDFPVNNPGHGYIEYNPLTGSITGAGGSNSGYLGKIYGDGYLNGGSLKNDYSVSQPFTGITTRIEDHSISGGKMDIVPSIKSWDEQFEYGRTVPTFKNAPSYSSSVPVKSWDSPSTNYVWSNGQWKAAGFR